MSDTREALRILHSRPCLMGPKNGSDNASDWCSTWLPDQPQHWCGRCLALDALAPTAEAERCFKCGGKGMADYSDEMGRRYVDICDRCTLTPTADEEFLDYTPPLVAEGTISMKTAPTAEADRKKHFMAGFVSAGPCSPFEAEAAAERYALITHPNPTAEDERLAAFLEELRQAYWNYMTGKELDDLRAAARLLRGEGK